MRRRGSRKFRRTEAKWFNRILTALGVVTLMFLTYTTFTYWLIQNVEQIRVTDKRVDYTTHSECKKFHYKSGVCTQRAAITTPHYIIITPLETFDTTESLYQQLQIDQNHSVTATGWASIQQRRIIDITDLTSS